MELIVAGKFNLDLEKTGGQGWGEEITEAVETAVQEDLAGNFLPRQRAWCNYRRTWAMVRQGKGVWYQTYYIMGSELRIFHNVVVRDPRHNSYNPMVIRYLRRTSQRERLFYLRHRMRLQLSPLVRQTRTWADKIFTELRRAVPKPYKRSARHNSWVLA